MYIDQLFTSTPIAESVNAVMSRSRRPNTVINEAWLREDPQYIVWKNIGRELHERDLSQDEILTLFGNVEQAMTNRDTGANRTMLGRAKDVTTAAAGKVKGAVDKILGAVQNSVPVQAVDVAYDQATNALNKVVGGDKGKVMKAITAYRNLAKAYPKTAGFAKAALVAIAGLATGGAGLPIIAGLTYGLDSAIKGDRLSTVLGKGSGAAALAWAGQQVAGAFKGTPADAAAAGAPQPPGMDYSYDNFITANPTTTLSPAEFAARQASGSLPAGSLPPEYAMGAAQTLIPPDEVPPEYAMGAGQTLIPQTGGELTSYTVKKGDTLSQLAADNNVSVKDIMQANPDITDPNVIKVGQKINIPAETGNPVYQDGVGTAAGRVQEAIERGIANAKLKTLPVNELIDHKLTVMGWALNESVGKTQGRSLHLTEAGVNAVFANINRVGRSIVKELRGVPGSMPGYLAPAMPDAPGKPVKPGIIGKGLNWLNKAAGKVGSWAKSAGHELTTGVTQKKLQMLWHQVGKPTDSDQLARWLQTQKVPVEVVAQVYQQMGIPEPGKIGADKSFAKIIKPGTNRYYTRKELDALQAKQTGTTPAAAAEPDTEPETEPAAKSPASGGAGAFGQMASQLTPSATGGRTTQTATGLKHTASAANPNQPAAAAAAPAPTPKQSADATARGQQNQGFGFNRDTGVAFTSQAEKDAFNASKQQAQQTPAQQAAPAAKPTGVPGYDYAALTKMPGMEKLAQKKPDFSMPSAYGQTTYTMKPPTINTGTKKAAPAMAESQAFIRRTMSEVKQQLARATTKEDVNRIKSYIDREFVRHGLVNESYQTIRDNMIRKVVNIGAQRRREAAGR